MGNEKRKYKYDRYRNACITCWKKPKEEDINNFCQYFIGQAEYAKTTQKLHFQCYAEFGKQVSMRQIKKVFGNDAHIEARKHEQKHAIGYCQKLDSKAIDKNQWEYEFGVPCEAGKRSDLDNMLEMIIDDIPTWEIIKEHKGNGLRHVNHIVRCQKIYYNLDKEVQDIEKAQKFKKLLKDTTNYRDICMAYCEQEPKTDADTLNISFSDSDEE